MNSFLFRFFGVQPTGPFRTYSRSDHLRRAGLALVSSAVCFGLALVAMTVSGRYSVNSTPEQLSFGVFFMFIILGAMAGAVCLIAVLQTQFSKDTPDMPYAVLLHGELAGFTELTESPDGTVHGVIMPETSRASKKVLGYVRSDPSRTLTEHITIIDRDMSAVPLSYGHMTIQDESSLRLSAKIAVTGESYLDEAGSTV